MEVYIDIVIALNFLVDFFLLMGTNRLCGFPTSPKKALLAAGIGGLYGGICLLPAFHFLGNLLWRIVSLALMSVVAFGFHLSALRRGIVLLFLSMALGGIALGLGNGGFWSLVAAAAGVCILCAIGFHGKLGITKYIPVELYYKEKHVRIMALQDTGNTLRDPITGKPVLVIGADVAQQLTGLTNAQLRRPVESMGSIPGLHLIPYRAVGQENGMLLALRFRKVKIGTWQGSSLVAFAPEAFPSEGAYQALTGGMV